LTQEIEKKLEVKEKVLSEKEKEALEKEKVAKEKEFELEALTLEKQLQEEQLKEKSETLKQTERINWFVIIIAAMIISFTIIQIRALKRIRRKNLTMEAQNQQIQQYNEELKNKNRNITSSINYAKRIQDAMLPSEHEIKTYFPESFILFKPKDIVSGDFYWFKHIDGYKSEFVEIKSSSIIAAIDCTGHGVPGAFMSMMGNEILNRIVVSNGITTSDGILNNLNKDILKALRQDETESKDGMDLARCMYSKEQNLLTYSGAKNPLVYIRDGQLHTIKADKMPIGGSQMGRERKFTKHQLLINRPTYFYIYTDGYQDQFGGGEARKFMSKRLKNLFLSIHDKPMEDQKELLEQTYNDWKGDHPQIDDVLIIGFRLDPYTPVKK